ncbi:hypothetical protein HPP92_006604 [Vanilla planifolia]|uniref:Uncharacterized protein n=1 Tax=Vanilla planifolia TaxID=51239 RepID=A0A835V7V1_VANPL|nr:hypothetical protein HPP92_006604 [Vanilla planifolia]
MNLFFFFFSNISVHLPEAHPTLVCVTTWMALIAAVIAAGSLAPEAAFVWALSPASSFAGECGDVGAVRLPLDAPPGEVLCFPAGLFGRTGVDLLVPPIFAAVVVAGAACFVRAIALWETDEDPS